jgi:hypothetical protein
MANLLKNIVSIICHACVLISYWAGLFIENDKEALVAGVNTMLRLQPSCSTRWEKMGGCY